MPTMENHTSEDCVKMLIVGNSGVGKTGLLGTLAATGQRVIVADFDSGLDILRDPKVLDPKLRSSIIFETFYDRHRVLAGKLMPEVNGYSRFLAALSDWKLDGKSIGGLHSWDSSTTFVIDSLTFLGEACMHEVLKLTNHIGQRPTQPEWGSAIDMQESVIEMLYNPAVKCNVVVMAHLMSVSDETAGGVAKLMPSALGKKFPAKISRYFNNVVLLQKKGSGAAVTREFITTATHNTDLKVSKPSAVAPVEPPDLGALFRKLRGA